MKMKFLPHNTNQKSNKGFALPAALVILVILLILIPALIINARKDAKDSQNAVEGGKSFSYAEMGQDRGVWKLRESNSMWQSAKNGTAIAGYNDDVEHDGGNGGKYKIKFSAGPGSNEVTIVSKGKSGTDVRAIKGIYSKGSSSGTSSTGNAVTVLGNLQRMERGFTVHWGPVKVWGHINVDDHTDDDHVEGSTAKYFPRKYSAGKIKGRDEVNNSNNGAMPGDNWSTYDYAAFYNLGAKPSINLDQLRTEAKSSCVPKLRKMSSSSAAAHYTGGGCDSGYYTEHVQIKEVGSEVYNFSCSTCVIFVEGKVEQFPSSSFLNVKALVATGNVTYGGRSTDISGVTVPSHASLEYQHSSLGTYFTSLWSNSGTTSLKNIGLHGFLYVGGNLMQGDDHGSDHSGSHTSDHRDGDEDDHTGASHGHGHSSDDSNRDARILGSVFVVGNSLTRYLYVYYDETVDSNMATTTTEAQVDRSSWDEIKADW